MSFQVGIGSLGGTLYPSANYDETFNTYLVLDKVNNEEKGIKDQSNHTYY